MHNPPHPWDILLSQIVSRLVNLLFIRLALNVVLGCTIFIKIMLSVTKKRTNYEITPCF